jgi:chromosome segregation ATPase
MATPKPALDQIKELQEKIKALSADAVATLKGEKRNLEDRIKAIDEEIFSLTGEKPPEAEVPKTRKPRAKVDKGEGKKPDLQELKEILKGLPNKTLSVRAEGYDTANIKTLAEANPHLFKYEKSAYPKITLIKG